MHSGRLNFMMLAGADAIAAGAQPPSKGSNIRAVYTRENKPRLT